MPSQNFIMLLFIHTMKMTWIFFRFEFKSGLVILLSVVLTVLYLKFKMNLKNDNCKSLKKVLRIMLIQSNYLANSVKNYKKIY